VQLLRNPAVAITVDIQVDSLYPVRDIQIRLRDCMIQFFGLIVKEEAEAKGQPEGR